VTSYCTKSIVLGLCQFVKVCIFHTEQAKNLPTGTKGRDRDWRGGRPPQTFICRWCSRGGFGGSTSCYFHV